MRFRIVEFKHPNETYWEVQRRFMILWLFPDWDTVDKDGSRTLINTFKTKEEAEIFYGKLIRKYAKTEELVIEEYDTSSGKVRVSNGEIIKPEGSFTLPDRP